MNQEIIDLYTGIIAIAGFSFAGLWTIRIVVVALIEEVFG